MLTEGERELSCGVVSVVGAHGVPCGEGRRGTN